MLAWLHQQGKLSERKARLFAVACCRRIWRLLTDERSRQAVEAVERFADERASMAELINALNAHDETEASYEFPSVFFAVAYSAWVDARWDYRQAALEAAEAAGCAATTEEDTDDTAGLVRCVIFPHERAAQAALLRDIVNPFAPHDAQRISPSNPEIVTLAEQIYERRLFDQLPEIAARLRYAGYSDQELLDHLDSPGPHVRGCWAVDRLLAR